METTATVKLVLDSREKGESRKQLKIRVTFERIPRLYSTETKVLLTKDELENPKLKAHKHAMEKVKRSLSVANEIVRELGQKFTFDAFGREYKQRLYARADDKSLFTVVADRYIKSQELQPKTIASYCTAVNWLCRFSSKPKFSLMTDAFVKDFITFVKKTYRNETGRDISENTLRIYLRSLKAIYNEGIRAGHVKGTNPFANIKGQSLNSVRREKTALDDDELGAFLAYQPQNTTERFAKDYFILSLQLSGANLGDILALKNENIVNGEVCFRRRKTRKSGLITVIPFTSIAEDIMRRYGVLNPTRQSDYILPYLVNCTTQKAIDNKIHDVIKRINKGLESISANLNLWKLTTYHARHTYGAHAQSVLSAEQLQKFFGHTSSRTTQTYLQSISRSVRDKNRELLESIAPK